MHLSATLRAHAISGALRHRASSIRTADRLEPPGRCFSTTWYPTAIILCINSVEKKKMLSSGSPSKVTNYYSNRSVRGPWPTTSMYFVFCASGPQSYLWLRSSNGFWVKSHVIPIILAKTLQPYCITAQKVPPSVIPPTKVPPCLSGQKGWLRAF